MRNNATKDADALATGAQVRKLTKRELDIQTAYQKGWSNACEQVRKNEHNQREQDNIAKERQLLDSRLRIVNAVGQLMQQMSSMVEGAYHALKELK